MHVFNLLGKLENTNAFPDHLQEFPIPIAYNSWQTSSVFQEDVPYEIRVELIQINLHGRTI